MGSPPTDPPPVSERSGSRPPLPPPRGDRWTFPRALLGQVALLLASLLLAEGLLQAASYWSLDVRRLLASGYDEPSFPDEQLGRRGNPLTPDHDSHGFRNAQRPAHADIVTLGDSQTYGVGVDASDAWPRVLSSLTNRSVYSMALPGYGPAQYLLLLDEALTLAPRRVIVAPYFGNDLFDCFRMSLRHAEFLAPINPTLKTSAAALEREAPLAAEINRRFRLGAEETLPTLPSRPFAHATHLWVSRHVKLYGLLRTAKNQLARRQAHEPLESRDFAPSVAALSTAQRQFAAPFDSGTWRTILTVPYRALALDDRDPRIRLGFEVCRDALVQLGERARAVGVTVLVVLLPTKERVFWSRADDPERYPELRELVATEDRLKRELIATLQSRGVPYLDLLVPLQAAAQQPYFEDADGHPSPVGHRVIAAAIAEHLNGPSGRN